MCQPDFTLNNDHNPEVIDNNNEDVQNALPDIDESDSQSESDPQSEEPQTRYTFAINFDHPELVRYFNNLRLGNDEREADDGGNSSRPDPSYQLFRTYIYNLTPEQDLQSHPNQSPPFILNIHLDDDENGVNNGDEPTVPSINRVQNRRRRHHGRFHERRGYRRVIKQLKMIKRVLRETNRYLRHANRLLQRNLSLRTPAQGHQNSTNS